MQYRYEAYAASGNVVQGTLEAESEEAAEQLLWQSDLTIVSLKRERALPTKEELFPTLFGIKRRDVIVFTRELSTLLKSGIAVVQGLEMLQAHTTNAAFRRVIQEIIADVSAGGSLSQGCARHSGVFPPLYVRLLAVGETVGNLDEVLEQLVVHMEKEEALGRRVRGALAYPAFVLSLAVVVVLIMMNFVLPALTGILAEFGGDLPLATRLVVGVARFVNAFFLEIVAVLIVVPAGIWLYSRSEGGQRRLDYLTTQLPIVSDVVLKANVSRFARTMTTLLGAGISLTETMDLVLASMGNLRLRDALLRVRTRVLEGQALSQSLNLEPVFPRMIGQMISVGEETGALETNLNTLADFYEQESDRAVSRLAGALEPALIVVVGLIVGLIAISIISPIYGIMQRIR